MERIYLAYSKKTTKDGFVKVRVFLKDVLSEHIESLKSFLGHQNITVSDFDANLRDKIVELSYFDEGFNIKFLASRWSYFRLRSYIHTYLDSWKSNVSLYSRYLESYKLKDDEVKFDDSFYLDVGILVDECEDNYYRQDRSIAIFLTGILQLFKESLKLYWASASLKDTVSEKLTYWNCVPASIPKSIIQKAQKKEHAAGPPVLYFPVTFKNEHIADFHLQLGAFSPAKPVIEEFVGFVLQHIDDFIYGDLLARRDRYYFHKRIKKLEEQCGRELLEPEDIQPVKSEKDSARLLMFGATEMKTDLIEMVFKKEGFDHQKLEKHLEYDKMKSFDINNLKRMRSRYDGIVLGPMPHNVLGDMSKSSLISMMEATPSEYPPFVVVRTQANGLKITKSALRSAVQHLSRLIEQQDRYEL